MGGQLRDGSSSGWKLGTIAVLFAVAAVVSVGTGVVIAQDGNEDAVAVERDGPTIKIQIQKGAFENATGNETVTVTVGNVTQTFKANFSKESDTISGRLRITLFRNVKKDLESATVTISLQDSSTKYTEVDELDLRYVEKSGSATIIDRAVALPVNESATTGIQQGTQVPVVVSSSGSEPLSVTGTYRDGAILIEISDLRDSLSVFKSLIFQVLPDTPGDVQYQINLRKKAQAYVTPRSDAAIVSHPLIFDGSDYSVVVKTTSPDGTYSQTLTAHGTAQNGGQLSLPEEILYAKQLEMRISTQDGQIVYERSGSVSEVLEPTAGTRVNGSWDGNHVRREDNQPFKNISAIWIHYNGELTRYNGSELIDEGALDVTQTEVEAGARFTALLVREDENKTKLLIVPENASQATDGRTESELSGGPFGFLLGDGLWLILASATGMAAFAGSWFFTRNRNVRTVVVSITFAIVMFGILYGYEVVGEQSTSYLIYLAVAALGFVILVGLRILRFPLWAYLASVIVFVTFFVTGAAGLILSDVPVPYGKALVGGIVFGIVSAAGPTGFGWRKDRDVGATGGRAKPTPTTYDVTVRVEDETGTPVPGPIPVTLRGARSGTEQVEVKGGKTKTDLREDQWTAQVNFDGERVTDERYINGSGHELVLRVRGAGIGLEVTDSNTGEPVSGARITVSSSNGRWTGETDSKGQWAQTVPRSTGQVQVQVDHDLYEEVSWSSTVDGKKATQLEMRPLLGTISIAVNLDGRGVPDMPIQVRRHEGDKEFEQATNDDGTVTFSDIPIGEYSIKPLLDDYPPQFATSRVSARVQDGQSTHKQLEVSFDYVLSEEVRQQIRSLRVQTDDIATVPRWDGAIPTYYASVLDSVLDTIENVPNSGYTVLRTELDPDALVDAMLSAAEEGINTIDNVMTSKRNIDLFSACSDLPEVTVKWSGTVSLERIAELAGQEIGQQRGTVLERLETVDDRISEAVSDVAEVSPAREMWEDVRTMVRDNTGATQIESAAFIVVAEALLDAIAELFEHDSLRKRMERTVY